METIDQTWRPTLPPRIIFAHRAGRAAALTSALCATMHIPMFFSATMSAMTVIVMATLAAACIACSVHLWRGPTVRDWSAMGALATGMIAVHYMSMTSNPGTRHAGHSDHAAQSAQASSSGSMTEWMSVATNATTILNVGQVATSLVVLAMWRLGTSRR